MKKNRRAYLWAFLGTILAFWIPLGLFAEHANQAVANAARTMV